MVCFDGGRITSDGGGLLLREMDHRLGMLHRLADCFGDYRNPNSLEQSVHDLVAPRVYGLALGYEDLNDHDALRSDSVLALQVDRFLEFYETPPREIWLDVDATDDPLHGLQEGRFFHGYYRYYCYLPLYIFCGEHLLCARLRPSNQDDAAGSVDELERIVGQLRACWPTTRIVIRGDSGF